MTTISAASIANVAYRAGFRGDGLVAAVSVALAESDGNTTITHKNSDGSIDRGLWQFNSRWHPEVSAAAATNPDQAAAAAFRVSKGGTDWHEWATWPVAAAAESGRARLAVAQVGKGQGVTAASSTSSAGTSAIDASATEALSPGAAETAGWEDWLGPAAGLLSGPLAPLFILPDVVGGGDAVKGMGSLLALGRVAVSGLTLAIRGAAWVADAHNWLRVVEIIGGGAALVIGLKMLADSGVDSPVTGVARAGVKGATGAVKAVKAVQSTTKKAALAVATDGASAAAGAAAKGGS